MCPNNTAISETHSEYWHVTLKENLENIVSNGLQARIGERSQLLGESLPAVYVFNTLIDAETALGQWLGDEFEEEDELVILKVKPDTPPDFNTQGDKTHYESMFFRDVRPHEIVAHYSEEDVQWLGCYTDAE